MIKNVVMSQNIRNNAKLQKWSKYNDLHRFDVKTIYNVEVRRKTFKTTQNCKSNQITMNCIDITSKWSKYNDLHRFDVKTIYNVEVRRKTFKTMQNCKSNQITMNCVDLTSKRSKMLSNVANHSKQR